MTPMNVLLGIAQIVMVFDLARKRSQLRCRLHLFHDFCRGA